MPVFCMTAAVQFIGVEPDEKQVSNVLRVTCGARAKDPLFSKVYYYYYHYYYCCYCCCPNVSFHPILTPFNLIQF